MHIMWWIGYCCILGGSHGGAYFALYSDIMHGCGPAYCLIQLEVLSVLFNTLALHEAHGIVNYYDLQWY